MRTRHILHLATRVAAFAHTVCSTRYTHATAIWCADQDRRSRPACRIMAPRSMTLTRLRGASAYAFVGPPMATAQTQLTRIVGPDTPLLEDRKRKLRQARCAVLRGISRVRCNCDG